MFKAIPLVASLFLLLVTSCGVSAPPCGPQTCGNGCCGAEGTCYVNASGADNHCGGGGGACADCTLSSLSCNSGVCCSNSLCRTSSDCCTAGDLCTNGSCRSCPNTFASCSTDADCCSGSRCVTDPTSGLMSCQ